MKKKNNTSKIFKNILFNQTDTRLNILYEERIT